MTIPSTSQLNPENIMTPKNLTVFENNNGQLAAQYSAILTDSRLGANFYTIKEGVQVPAWRIVFTDAKTQLPVEVSVPGMAVVTVSGGPEHIINMIDPTKSMDQGPQLVGSIFKPLVVFYAVTKDPSLANATFDASPAVIDGLAIKNSMLETDYAGQISLAQTLSASANVPMAHLWALMRDRDPNFWEHFQQFSKDQWGIVYYEVNDKGQFVPRVNAPLSDAGFGNLYIGGLDPHQSGLVTVAEAYQKIGEAGYMGKVDGVVDKTTKQHMIDAGKLILDGLTNEDYKHKIPIWDKESMAELSQICGSNGELCAGKTGTQTGVDQYGNWIAIRAGTFFMKYYPATSSTPAHVDVLGVITSGKDANNNPTELDWASHEVLPIARKFIEATGLTTSPESAQQALNTLFTSPETSQYYNLGAISVEQFYPFLKGLSMPNADGVDPYAALSDAILHDKTKYLFVDLIGPAHDNIQGVGIHIKDATGADKLFTLNVSADLIEPAGPAINHFIDSTNQTRIYELLAEAIAKDPEKFGGLLNELKSSGVNFVSTHDYETSPLLFAIHEQMVKNHEMVAGAEEFGMIMKQLGLDPKTTIFVNDETFKVLDERNQQSIIEAVFAQREYLNLATIYESSGQPGSLDKILYTAGNSNEAYQLLKVLIETKTSQTFEPVASEKSFLVRQFEALMSNPERANALAPDVVKAYNLYNQMSLEIARGEAPTQEQSQAFIGALNNFTKTSNEYVLRILGIEKKGVANINNVVDPVIEALLNKVIVENVPEPLKGNSAFDILDYIVNSGQDKNLNLDKEVISPALAFYEIVSSSEFINNSDKNAQLRLIIEGMKEKGFYPKEELVSQFVYNGKQCVTGGLIINDIITKIDPEHFSSIEGIPVIGKESQANGLIQPLIDAVKLFQSNNIGADFVGIKSINPPFNLTAIGDKDIVSLSPGDVIAINSPWMGDNDPGHYVTVLHSGVDAELHPYAIIIEMNSDNHGSTVIRTIDHLEELIPEVSMRSKDAFPGSEAIFGLISLNRN